MSAALSHQSLAPHQKPLDKLVQIPIQHVLHVGALNAGAQVLDEFVGVEHVVANLGAEVDTLFSGFHLVALGVALVHLNLVEARFEHAHEQGARPAHAQIAPLPD